MSPNKDSFPIPSMNSYSVTFHPINLPIRNIDVKVLDLIKNS